MIQRVKKFKYLEETTVENGPEQQRQTIGANVWTEENINDKKPTTLWSEGDACVPFD